VVGARPELGQLSVHSAVDDDEERSTEAVSDRHFGDTTNSDVAVGFSGTAVTVLKALAPGGG